MNSFTPDHRRMSIRHLGSDETYVTKFNDSIQIYTIDFRVRI